MLHRVVHDNRSQLWCGPAAIAAVTGQPTSVIHRILRDVSGCSRIKGTHAHHLVQAMKQLGFAVDRRVDLYGRMTLGAFSKEYEAFYAELPAVVFVTGHFVVLHGQQFLDNRHTTPAPVVDVPRRRARVDCAWRFKETGQAQMPERSWEEKQRTIRAASARKARALATKHGIKIEREDSYWWVLPPSALENCDPHDGDHIVYDGVEMLKAVEDYVRVLGGTQMG